VGAISKASRDMPWLREFWRLSDRGKFMMIGCYEEAARFWTLAETINRYPLDWATSTALGHCHPFQNAQVTIVIASFSFVD
jgi:hypothetical protein